MILAQRYGKPIEGVEQKTISWDSPARVHRISKMKVGSFGGAEVKGAQIESSEVMLGSFVSASSSRLDPCSTCSRCFPCGAAARDLCSGSGLTANRINLPNASELYPAFDIGFPFSSTSALL
jgi:hypothetical protein